MGTPVASSFLRGDVVVIPFPFSDLSASKRRPALLLAALPGNDAILCQITSQARKGLHTIPVVASDFMTGGLQRNSYIRPERLFTADTRIIAYTIGHLSDARIQEVLAAIRTLLT